MADESFLRETDLEEESMFQHTGDIEMIAVSSNTNHQSIIWHLILVTGVQTASALHHTSLYV